MNMGKRSEIMTAESVGPGVGLRTGGAKNHRPFNVFLAQPNSNPWLMQEIRKNRKTMEIEDAVDKAMADMPEDYVIRPFLDAHKVEVSGMLLTE